jgi:hypothetical protein
MINMTDAGTVTDENLRLISGVADQLVWLNLSYSNITATQMNFLQKLTNLRVLYLNHTGLTDDALVRVGPLPELRLLSLVDTKITDRSIPVILKFPRLDHLFLYQSQVTVTGIQQIIVDRLEVQVDTGHYELKKLPTDTIVYKKISQKK